MNSNSEQKLKAVVTDFVNKGFMFTAYDITKTLRNDGDRVRHGEVNQIVQDMFGNNELGMYTRDLVNVGAPVQPWVYYHPYSDANNYKSDWIENNPTQTGMKQDVSATDTDDDDTDTTLTVPPAVSSTSANTSANTPSVAPVISSASTPSVKNNIGNVGNVDIMVVTANDRLQIPVRQIRKVANQHGYLKVNKALDMKSGKKFLVVSPDGTNGYKVNKDGRVRISGKDLVYLDPTLSGGTYETSIKGTDIVVEKV